MSGKHSLTRQNYADDVEQGVNKQINVEFYSSYLYLSMATYFSRSEVCLPHISKWMRSQSNEKRNNALKLIQYQTLRGGKVIFDTIQIPEKESWESALEAFETALDLEKKANVALIELHDVGEQHKDPHFCAFIEECFLRDQAKSIDEAGRYVAILKRAGQGLGEYIFDTKNFESSEEAVVNETITELAHF